jgi:hypothetical protein
MSGFVLLAAVGVVVLGGVLAIVVNIIERQDARRQRKLRDV